MTSIIKINNILLKIFCIVLACLFIIPTQVFADAYSGYSLEVDTEKAMKYITVNENGTWSFDKEEALSKSESEFIIEVGEAMQVVSKAYAQPNARGLTLPIYGNWCGPGHGSGVAIDWLDAQCKIHDECYEDKGYFNCGCDKTLTDSIDKKYSSLTGSQKVYAAAVGKYFEAQQAVRLCWL